MSDDRGELQPGSDSVLSWSFGEAVASGVPGPAADRPRPDTSPAARVGQRFGDVFDIEAVIGEGGMGVVYRARDLTSGRRVALKVMSARLEGHRLERFQREGQLTAALRHPGIVRVHSGGLLEGVPFLAYELVEGGRTLEDVLGEVPLRRRVELLRDVAAALGYAHAHGVVHRDVKPDNVLLDAEGAPRLADFGLARGLGLERLTQTGAAVGTPPYMAPEQFTGERDKVGAFTDVWALGVILYRALSGRFPFQAATMAEMAALVCGMDPASPRPADGPQVALEAICLKALAKDRFLRYPDAGAVAAELERALRGEPVLAASPQERLRTLWLRHRRPALLGAVACAALVLAALVVPGARPAAAPGMGVGELERLVVRVRTDRAPREELAQALAALPAPATPAARAAAHLVLAAEPAPDLDGWEERLLHARRAAELDPELQGQAEECAARALAALGRWEQAAEAWAAARSAGAGPQVELARAQALLEAEEHAEAEAVCLSFLAGGEDPDGIAVLVRCRARGGDLPAARQALERLPPGEQRQVLQAELAELAGQDPRPLLRETIRRWPRSRRPRLALARHQFLKRGAPWSARDLLAALNDPQDLTWRDQQLVSAVSAVTAEPPRWSALRRAPPPLRAAAAAWLLSEAERDLALAAASDPRRPAPAGALAPSALQSRASACFSESLRALGQGGDARLRGRAHLGLATLAGEPDADLERALVLLPDDPRPMRLRAKLRFAAHEPIKALADLDAAAALGPEERAASLLRGRILVELAREREAIVPLQRAAGDPPRDPEACRLLASALRAAGQPQQARQAMGRRVLLEGLRQEEAEARYRQALALGPITHETRVLETRLRQVLELDPLHIGAGYYRGQCRYLLGEGVAGLRDCMLELQREPALWSEMNDSLFFVSGISRGMFGGGDIAEVLRQVASESPDALDRRLRAALLALSVEHEQEDSALVPALEGLDEVLTQDPTELWAWTARGFLDIRRGELSEAAHDLRVVQEAAPDSAVLYFYLALLAAAQHDPDERVLELLQRARALRFEPMHREEWSLANYPELVPYLERSTFKPFLDDLEGGF